MKKVSILMILLIALSACQKDFEERSITYLITGLANPYRVTYVNETGEATTENIAPVNDDQVWHYNFTAQQGDILYMFAEFTDIELVPTKFKFRILINGKVFKESFGYDHNIGDTLFRVKRAGTVPF